MKTVVDHLTDAEIVAKNYKRGPLGKDIFTLNIDTRFKERPIMVWEGLADCDVKLSKKFHQAVINANEGTRQIKVETSIWAKNKKGIVASLNRRDRDWSRPFNINFPRTPKIHIDEKGIIKNPDNEKRPYDGAYLWNIPLIASIPKTSQSFLVGMDEITNFISMLPKTNVSSVKEAHEILKADEARIRNTIRQGEWFFVPIYADELTAVEEKAEKNIYVGTLETRSSHFAHQYVVIDKVKYAKGYVRDSRRGHHTNLFLDNWHKVVRNRERTSNQPQRRYWD